MGLSDSVGLLFRVKADTSSAQTELKQFTAGLLGDSKAATSALEGLSGAAVPVAAAITAISTAAVAAAASLFSLAKQTSDFGSAIFDATEKTGLAAETISAFQIAAQQSGTSLDAVTGGLAKFAKTIGEAQDGSDKAQASLDKLHVTSTDLDTALGEALTTIAKYPPGVEQMTAAQAAFGRSGADLLPFIKSFDGNLPGLIQKCKDLGLVISQEDARASDEFGDTLDQLTAQVGAAGHQFAFGFMPEITRSMASISKSVADNKDVWREWGEKVGNILTGTQFSIELLVKASTSQFSILGTNLDGLGGHIWTALNPLNQLGDALDRLGSNPLVKDYVNGKETYGPYYTPGAPGKDPLPGSLPVGSGPSPLADFGKRIDQAVRDQASEDAEAKRKAQSEKAERERQQREREREQKEAEERMRAAERDRVAEARQLFIDETAYFEAEARKRYAVAEEYAKREGKTEEDLARFKEFLDTDVLENRKAKLQQYMDALVKGTKEYERAQQEMKILELEIETTRAQNAHKQEERDDKRLKAEQKLREERRKSWNEYVEQLKDESDREAAADRQRTKDRGDRLERDRPVNSGIGGAIAGATGTDLPSITDSAGVIKTQADYIKSVYADLQSAAGNAIGSMIQGLAQLAINWVLTGKFSAKAAMQMAAGILMGLAVQSAIKGIFELAEAAAAAARYDFASAALHKAAATIYFKVAAVAGAIGVGVGLASRAGGGGSSSEAGATGGYGSGGDGAGQPPPLNFTSRFDGYQRRQNEISGYQTEVLERIEQKLNGVPPGEILVLGSRDPAAGEALAGSINEHLSSDLRASSNFKRANGEY